MKYMGPFLRINTISKENIEKQLLYFSRESFKHVVLNSKCGLTLSTSQFRTKNIPNFDINIFKKNSPLLCIYKKASPKLHKEKDQNGWDESTFKKEVPIISNGFMNIMLLDLQKHYNQFENIDNKLYSLGKLYSQLALKQLDFLCSNFRNSEGVFVDKKDCCESLANDVKFEEKDKKFKFSDQAILMTALYKASLLPENEDSESYKNFSEDILDMFVQFREGLYDLSIEELNKLCFSINIFYEDSKNEVAKNILYDLCDLIIEKYEQKIAVETLDKVENICMMYINLNLAYNNLSIEKFKLQSKVIFNKLDSLYDSERGIFIKESEKKDIDFSCQEIVLYSLCQLLNHRDNENASINSLMEVYKRQLVNSGIILSWPDAPSLDSADRYRSFSMKSEDMLDDQYFKMPTIQNPDDLELAPVLTKSVSYNRKKELFSQGKTTFDSTKNMPLLYTIHYLLAK